MLIFFDSLPYNLEWEEPKYLDTIFERDQMSFELLEGRFMHSSIESKKLLSFVTSKEGGQVFIHADINGLNLLIKELTLLKAKLEQNECEHIHLLSPVWAGDELTTSKLKDQKGEDLIVHEVAIYGWNDEWKKKHGLL